MRGSEGDFEFAGAHFSPHQRRNMAVWDGGCGLGAGWGGAGASRMSRRMSLTLLEGFDGIPENVFINM
jgi:hypothetical protein